MNPPVVHVIGAGLGGLAAAVKVAGAGASVALYEATANAGGRCRSYHESALDMEIDNGNHLVLSGNRATMDYLDAIGARSELIGPAEASFPFVDLATRERWTLRPNSGPLPWWILSPSRRVPGTKASDYLSLGKLLLAKPGAAIGDVMECSGPLYEKLWRPLLLAALNRDPAGGSAALAASVVRETLARGGSACRPLIAANGLSRAFIDPALKRLEAKGAVIRFSQRLRRIDFEGDAVTGLAFGDRTVELGLGDYVILATPSWVAADLVPGLEAPTEQSAIVNGHFRFTPPPGSPSMLGVVGGSVEWIFAFANRISVTVSGADAMLERSREELAATFWSEIQVALGFEAAMPAWQVVKEKRATFDATPDQNARRPKAVSRWNNLFFAGDFTQGDLPATIEFAIRSGFRAAELVEAKQGQVH